MKEFNTECAYCGEKFTGKNRKAKYCSDSCRIMASRKRIEAHFAERNQYASYFDRENSKLAKEKSKLFVEKESLTKNREEFNEIYNKYWPKILMHVDSESHLNFYRDELRLAKKEIDRLKLLLSKNKVESESKA